MSAILDLPILVFLTSVVVLWLSAQAGDLLRTRFAHLKGDERADFGDVLVATLTLLGLIVGFTFSMAVSRYDQRKNYEEAEANAIGTEYARADLLPATDAARLRELLRKYLEQRILFYTTQDYTGQDERQLRQINDDTAKLQGELWSIVQSAALAQPTAVSALAVSGMNDVLNSQGYTQAAWWNRIPLAAWALMVAIAICCNLLLGHHARRPGALLFLISPLTVSIAFFLIADIDSPRGGVIRVLPLNLAALSQSLNAR
jgi:hypothetical protein